MLLELTVQMGGRGVTRYSRAGQNFPGRLLAATDSCGVGAGLLAGGPRLTRWTCEEFHSDEKYPLSLTPANRGGADFGR